MSSAKSRNFRRRAGDDDDESDNNFATPSSTNKPSAVNKPKKPISQPPKTLLSFADDEDESPFSRPPPSRSSASSSSSRLSKSTSAHKLSLSKGRITPRHTSSSIPSNVQPQAGVYTKEALLELQKNTKKTLVASARNKPNPQEPEVVLKGLIKPVNSNDLDSGTAGEDLMDVDEMRKGSSAVTDDEIKLGHDDNEEMPDQATIGGGQSSNPSSGDTTTTTKFLI